MHVKWTFALETYGAISAAKFTSLSMVDNLPISDIAIGSIDVPSTVIVI